MFRPRPRPNAKLRLFCFTPAGYGSSFYRDWWRGLPEHIEVCAVRLPGRENLRSLPPLTSFPLLLKQAEKSLAPYLDRPFALFGHSMGACLAFEAARRVRITHDAAPVALFVSGRRAPHIEREARSIHALPKDALLREIQQRYGGIPQALLDEPELLDLTLPILRADLAALESYEYVRQPKLDCPVSCFTGTDDHEITSDELEAWYVHTTNRFELTAFPGGHFYVADPSREAVLCKIASVLGNTVCSAGDSESAPGL